VGIVHLGFVSDGGRCPPYLYLKEIPAYHWPE
jgi:hypothetical protein